MNNTKIEWVKNPDDTQGFTWNPITGCLNGCEYCYARKLANGRLKSRYLFNPNVAGYDVNKLSGRQKIDMLEDPFYPRLWEDRLYHPWGGEPKGIFVCDMSDLFGTGIPEEWTRRVLNLCRRHNENRYYLLTKQAQNLIKFSPFTDNCWVGVTATNTDMAVAGMTALADIEAKVKYISLEPLLDRIPLNSLALSGISWVILGAQTKPYKPPKIEWVKELIVACDKASIPIFLKDNLRQMYGYTADIKIRQEMPVEIPLK